MADQAEPRRRGDAELVIHESIHDSTQVLELCREGVVAEAVWEGELAVIIHSASAQVEAHRGKTCAGESLGKAGKHSPILEALEAVHHEYGWTSGVSSSGTDVDQNLAECTRE
jgi:hypothetical protein